MPTARLFDLEDNADQSEPARIDRILDEIRAHISHGDGDLVGAPLIEFTLRPREDGEVMDSVVADARLA